MFDSTKETALTPVTQGELARMCCGTCRAIYRSGFMRCPADGTELTSFKSDPMIGIPLAEHYVIDECIGEGAMGRVYRAHHVRLERREFAIKILLGDLAADPLMRKRFAHEAQAASRLDHRNVVGVLDYGETDEGLLYLVMELVKGPTLSEIIDEGGPVPETQVIELAQQLCRGLSHAHDRELVHRDFKPDNVIVVSTDTGELARILDFGLAIISDPENSGTRLTQAGLVVGTPAYTSPEQALNKQLDHRTDLFSLGITLYEMLAGQLPFDGNVMEMVYANAHTEPPPIAERTPGVRVSAGMEAIVRRLLAKRREERFQSAREVIEALDALETPHESRQFVAAPVTAPERAPTALASPALDKEPPKAAIEAPKPKRGRAKLVVAALAIAGAAAAGVIYWSSTREPGEQEASQQVAPPSEPSAGSQQVAPLPAVTPTHSPDAAAPEPAPEPALAPATDEPTAKAPAPTTISPKVSPREARRKRRRKHRRGRKPATRAKEPVAVVRAAPPISTAPKSEPRRGSTGSVAGSLSVGTIAPPVVPPSKPKRSFEARATIASFSARGSLSRTVVRRAVDRVAPRFGRCYRDAAQRAGRHARASVSVRFKIDESGRARSLRVGSAPLPGLSSCLRSLLDDVRTRIAPDVGTVRVELTIRFTPRTS